MGSAPYTDAYTQRVRELADDRVTLLGGVWDQQLLDQLYAGALTYLHGHSVGGTNPSLLRAVGAATATIAFDVTFNREVLGSTGRYFHGTEDLGATVVEAEQAPEQTVARGAEAGERAAFYSWDEVARRYEQLCADLARDGQRRHRPSGRRRGRTALAPNGGWVDAGELATATVEPAPAPAWTDAARTESARTESASA